MVAEFVREQIFLNAEQELPYSIMVKTEEVDIEGEIVRAAAVIYGLNARHRKILIGDGASFVKKIRLFSKKRLKEYFGKPVQLTLRVKVNEGLMDDLTAYSEE